MTDYYRALVLAINQEFNSTEADGIITKKGHFQNKIAVLKGFYDLTENGKN